MLFLQLQVKLQEIDSIHIPPGGRFSPKLIEFQKKYYKVLSQSRDIATKIAQYGRSFSDVVVDFCKDKTISIEDRKHKIGRFIDKSKTFEQQAKDMDTAFNTLKTEFGTFVSTFATWAVDKEKEITERIKKIMAELEALGKKLEKLLIALYTMAGITVAAVPATAIAAALSGPFMPFVMIGGLLFAGASLISTIGIYIAVQNVKNEIAQKTREKKDLESQIDRIRTARTSLENLGSTSIVKFGENITVLATYWTRAQSDAISIQGWLNDGADDAEWPDSLGKDLKNGVDMYTIMATYLEEYARGVGQLNLDTDVVV
ncbi:hypothetical protein BDV23DRAFT_189657 [Aspergillus alliaceus]|uniref:Uncharacterized protein n=1 Tax=Petromyces alliaceus TaxID=209559 RepID=A0A5N7BQC1_PETAA|nr:hypothetical protein BDV23DRAFT_189657 [Aspergillus alliaceus]